MKRFAAPFFSLFFWFTFSYPAWSLSGQHVVELKKAGISDQTIQIIAQEKVVETAAFSITDIVDMKKAGVGEKTLRMIIQDGSRLKNSEPVVYGRFTQHVRNISPAEVINLSQNGVSDAVIQSVVEASRSDDQKARERAWRMLDNLQLRILTRAGGRQRTEGR